MSPLSVQLTRADRRTDTHDKAYNCFPRTCESTWKCGTYSM